MVTLHVFCCHLCFCYQQQAQGSKSSLDGPPRPPLRSSASVVVPGPGGGAAAATATAAAAAAAAASSSGATTKRGGGGLDANKLTRLPGAHHRHTSQHSSPGNVAFEGEVLGRPPLSHLAGDAETALERHRELRQMRSSRPQSPDSLGGAGPSGGGGGGGGAGGAGPPMGAAAHILPHSHAHSVDSSPTQGGAALMGMDHKARMKAKKDEEARRREQELLNARKAYFEERKQVRVCVLAALGRACIGIKW